MKRVQHKFTGKVMFRMTVVLISVLILVSGCVPSGVKELTINPAHVLGEQNIHKEIVFMLEELGYEYQPVRDPTTGQPVMVAEQNGQKRMMFRAKDHLSIHVEVFIRENDNLTELYFFEADGKQLSDVAMDYYRTLKTQVTNVFGVENVSAKRSLLIP